MVRSIFLSGVAGFLGSRVLARLARAKDRRIVCLVRGKRPEGMPSHVEYVTGDLLDPNAYAPALAGCDMVLHMAAATGKNPPAEYFRVNRDGTEALLQQAGQSGVERFVFVSSIAAKFRRQYRYFYAESKQAAEAVVAGSRLRWTIVRPTMILGKGSPVLESLARLAALPLVPIFGDGRVPVQPVFVEDLANCLVDILGETALDNTTLEIGGPDVLTIEEFVLRIRSAAGKPPASVVHLPARTLARSIGWMEPFLLPILPFTAGQLASFSNPGTAASHPWIAERQNRMIGMSEMLRSITHGYGSA